MSWIILYDSKFVFFVFFFSVFFTWFQNASRTTLVSALTKVKSMYRETNTTKVKIQEGGKPFLCPLINKIFFSYGVRENISERYVEDKLFIVAWTLQKRQAKRMVAKIFCVVTVNLGNSLFFVSTKQQIRKKKKSNQFKHFKLWESWWANV